MGAAAAALYASRGHSVVVADRSIELGQKITSAITDNGGTAVFAELDIASEESVKDVIALALKTYGRIDSAVHAAGIGGPSCPAHEVTAADYQKVVAIDQTGTFYLLKHLVAHWLKQEPRVVKDYTDYGLGKIYQRGCIVSLASINAHVASRNMSAYGISDRGHHTLSMFLMHSLLRISEAWFGRHLEKFCFRKCARTYPHQHGISRLRLHAHHAGSRLQLQRCEGMPFLTCLTTRVADDVSIIRIFTFRIKPSNALHILQRSQRLCTS